MSGSAGAQALARRLLWTGMAHPVPDGGPGPEDVTVVIPVRDRTAELALCLAGLGEYQVIVVDDGSRDPAAVAAVADAAGARCVHRAVNGGPAAARNTRPDRRGHPAGGVPGLRLRAGAGLAGPAAGAFR